MASDQVIVLEVERQGRRPRYHRGARLANGQELRPEACNLDDTAGTVNVLSALPDGLRRPWSQLCHRCWRGTDVLAWALELRDTYARVRAKLALGRLNV